MRLLDSVDPELYRGALYIVETLRARGFEALFAGGAVRDLLLGREVADIDITTSAPPEIIERIFPSTIPVGKQFGVIIVIMGSHQYEVATVRADSDYSDGRHPTRVSFTNARKDAQRRDFTVNALFYDPSTGEVLDFVGGRRDLERKIIRTVGDPRLRFEEDKLRLLRTVRFACLLGFQVEQDTLEQVHRLAQDILQVSASSSAQEGVYYLEVVQIAQAHQMASKSFTTASDPLGLSGTITINGTDVTIETTDSLYDIGSKINSQVDGVSASVLMVSEGDYRLTLSADDTGLANEITVDDPGALLDLTTTVSAQDAIVNVNSIQVQRSSNTIGDLIEGLAIDLKRAAPGTIITMRVSRDLEGVTEGIQKFVNAYNDVASFISQQFTYSEGESSALMGDLTLRGIQSNLQSRLLQTLSDFPDGWNALTFYGVSLDRYGSLGLDSSKFQEKFTQDPETTIQFFMSLASSLESYLKSVTDPYTGLIKVKTDTLQRQVEDMNEQIEHQERLLEKEQDRLMRQFVALEEALAQLQGLSSWLSQHIQASFNNL